MTNWQVFEIKDRNHSSYSCLNYNSEDICLDKYVEFADGYEKKIKVLTLSNGSLFVDPNTREFIEIDLDQIKLRDKCYLFEKNVMRKIPTEVALRRKINEVAQADPTVLAALRDAMDRVDQGKAREFEYKIEDRSNSNIIHHIIYRK